MAGLLSFLLLTTFPRCSNVPGSVEEDAPSPCSGEKTKGKGSWTWAGEILNYNYRIFLLLFSPYKVLYDSQGAPTEISLDYGKQKTIVNTCTFSVKLLKLLTALVHQIDSTVHFL